MRPRTNHHLKRGFTLVELGIVVLLIGIMTSFLLVVSYEGVRRANERATQALILKLDVAMADRVDALSTVRVPVNNAHRFLALSQTPDITADTVTAPRFLNSEERAQVIALVDYIRREVPDVFFVQDDPNYPLNFGGLAFLPPGVTPSTAPGVTGALTAYASYILPLGNSESIPVHYVQPNAPDFPSSYYLTFQPQNLSSSPPILGEVLGESQWNRHPLTDPATYRPAGEGIFGASYQAIAAFTKQLGYAPEGTNGVDDDGDGLIDELDGEGDGTRSGNTIDPFDPSGTTTRADGIANRLSFHTHNTARSEALYALLVEGQGPLGSVFRREDFTDREVADTDGDGLLEFVDSWGRPLQFFRWPVYYISDQGLGRLFQKGVAPYVSLTEPRQDNPLDPNRQLMAPAWWGRLQSPMPSPPTSSALMSPRAQVFQRHFFSIVDPYADDDTDPSVVDVRFWDRTRYYKRRAYFSKFLILSGGADFKPGISQFDVDYGELLNTSTYGLPLGTFLPRNFDLNQDGTGAPDEVSLFLNLVESQAFQTDPTLRVGAANAGNASLYQFPADTGYSSVLRSNWAVDDLTNLSVTTAGSGGR